MNKRGYILRALVIVLAFVFPFICIFKGEPIRQSLSQYWLTDLQPLFIVTNAATAYFLFSLDKWKMPAILLLLLTAFPVDTHNTTHNIFAYAFFIASIKPLYYATQTQLQWYTIPYLGSLLMFPFGFFYVESVCICVLCMFHGHLLYLKWQLETTKKIVKQTIEENNS